MKKAILQVMKIRIKDCINLFLKYNSTIFYISLGICGIISFFIYPAFSTFLVFSFWFNFLVLFYVLTLLQVPVLIITVGALCIIKSLILILSAPLLTKVLFVILFSTLSGFFCYYKNVILSLTLFKQFKTLEEEVENKLEKDLTLFGALNTLTTWFLLMFNLIYFVQPSCILESYNSFSSFFGPASFTFSLLYIISGLTEMLLALSFSTNFFSLLQFLCLRTVKVIIGLFIEFLDFHDHCVGGIHDPLSKFEIVKSYQKDYFGAVATTKDEVNSLLLYRTLDSVSPPPMQIGTDFVDKVKLDALNSLLLEQEKANFIAIKNATEEASKHFIYDGTITESENRANFHKFISDYKKRTA